MSAPGRRIHWLNALTVVSAAILIGAEVFGAAFAGSWALTTLFGLDQITGYILDAVFFGCGMWVMVSFVRGANRVEPLVTAE
ncbi:MAG: hypothetical protein WCI56_12425 [Hyphomicrobiales bacterium]